jgi:hypothetical protein
MSLADIKSLLIPEIKNFVGVPVIDADQNAPKPDGTHSTFKVTSPYLKAVGKPNEDIEFGRWDNTLTSYEEYNFVLSFSTYDMDQDISFDLSQKIRDWFTFYGQDFMDSNNLVVSDITGIQNRDILLVDDYERRNGFDVTLKTIRTLEKQIDIIETVSNN